MSEGYVSMGDGSPSCGEAEGEGGEDFYVVQSGTLADLPAPLAGHLQTAGVLTGRHRIIVLSGTCLFVG